MNCGNLSYRIDCGIVLNVYKEDDIHYTFLFQVIAREDKGSSVGIEYAYSRPATSLANPTDKQKARLF